MAWYDNNWNYRKPITVSNTGSALTDYQVLVTVDTATPVSSGKMLSNCNDIRFTSSDGSTLLNYWIESGCNTSSTKIWIKVTSILASPSTTTIYLYYGNPSATSLSNGTNTFIIFNAGDTLIGTTAVTGTGYNAPVWSIVSNKIHGSPGSENSLSYLYFNTTTGTSSYIIEADIQASAAGAYQNQFGFRFHTTQSATISRLSAIWVETNKIYTISNSTGTAANSSSTTLSATLHKWKLTNDGSVKTLYIDGTQVVTQTETIDAENIGLYYYNASGESVTEDYSNIRVRKYASSEPTTCIGGEEVSTVTWLTGWTRRKLMTVTGSTSGAQTDYQIKLIVHKATGTDTSTDIYLGTNVKDDFSDIRFTSNNGSTLLSYWIESYTSGSVATVWIKIPSIPTNPCTSTIYTYYGNSSATSLSNGTNTFLFFDNFEGTTLGSSWSDPNSIATVSSSIVTLVTPTSGSFGITNSYTVPTDPIRIRSSMLVVDGWARQGKNPPGVNYQQFAASTGDNVYTLYQLVSGTWYTGGVTQRNVWYIWDVIGTGTNRRQLLNDVEKINIAATQPQGSLYVGIATNPTPATCKFDWLAVLKYVSPEPSFSTIGTEQSVTATLMTITPRESPCRVGICIVDISITWTNSGGSTIFTPTILIDSTPYSLSPITLLTGENIVAFSVSGLSVGNHTICPSPN